MSEVGVPGDSLTFTMDLLTSLQFAVVSREQSAIPQVLEQLEPDEFVMDDPLPRNITVDWEENWDLSTEQRWNKTISKAPNSKISRLDVLLVLHLL